MSNSALYLGIDGGGSKTEAIVVDSQGKIVGRGIAGGSNIHNCPTPIAIQNILTSITNTQLNSNSFAAACLGIAGLDTPSEISAFKKTLAAFLHTPKLQVYNDGYIAFRSGSNANRGICLIASTGSNCFGFLPGGAQVSAGDWGFLLGDQGSGFHLGQAILQQAAKEFDGRQPRSGLLSRVLTYFHVSDFPSLLSLIYTYPLPIDQIAGLAKIISEPEFAHHPFIVQECNQVVASLYQSFLAVLNKFDQPPHSFPIVLVGKLFLATNAITRPLIQKISAHYPSAHIITPSQSPAEAAARIALTL